MSKKATAQQLINYLRANEEDIADILDIDYEKYPEFMDQALAKLDPGYKFTQCPTTP